MSVHATRSNNDQSGLTDAGAEAGLPPCAAAVQSFRSHRKEGYSPAEALRLTLVEWRELCDLFVLVPHRAESHHQSESPGSNVQQDIKYIR